MCLIIQTQKVTEEPLTVYKVVSHYDGRFRSPLGRSTLMVQRHNGRGPGPEIGVGRSSGRTVEYALGEEMFDENGWGYYTFWRRADAISWAGDWWVLRCTIPAGTRCFRGTMTDASGFVCIIAQRLVPEEVVFSPTSDRIKRVEKLENERREETA